MVASTKKINLAILITCYNRKNHTIQCIDAIYKQSHLHQLNLEIFVVDDNSNDQTSETIRQKFPDVNIILGNGHLYWNGGMHLAFKIAKKKNFDFYLWLNDDMKLYPDAIHTLIQSYEINAQQYQHKLLITGPSKDPSSQTHTSGGLIKKHCWHPLRFKHVIPDNTFRKCDSALGNCLLIPAVVAKLANNLNENLTHNMGDMDYSMRCVKLGCMILSTKQYQGDCTPNSSINDWLNPSLNLQEKLKIMNHPKRIPFKEWYLYSNQHGGIFWFFFWTSPYIKLLITHLGQRVKKNITSN